jgi:hypothetical protein
MVAPSSEAIHDAEGRCSWCGYDLRGISSARCPECGLAPFDPTIIAKVVDASRHWIRLGAVCLAGSVVSMFAIRTPYDPLPARTNAVGTLVLVGVISFVPMLLVGRRSRTIRPVRRLIWLRCSFWLVLPVLTVPALLMTFTLWFRHRTHGLPPGNYGIAVAWQEMTSAAPTALFAISCVCLAIWWVRWRALRKSVGLAVSHEAAAAAAFVSISMSTVWALAMLTFAMADD